MAIPIKANGYTSAAFVGMAAFVLSVLYRKKQTRIECTSSFWNQFWQYIDNNNNGSRTKHIDHKPSFGCHLIFNDMHSYLHTTQPSNTVVSFLSTAIDHHLNHILLRHDKCFNEHQVSAILVQYLQQDPLQILLPLCGSSYDLYYISFLLRTKYGLNSKCFKIIGIDVSSTAITNFFSTHRMLYELSCYNPKLFYYSDFYRVWIYKSLQHGISIIENEFFSYFELSQALQSSGIAPSPCFMRSGSIDIIVDINAMSCCNPSDRKQYVKALKYWLSDTGSMLLNTYSYDSKLSNYPPFACHPNRVCDLFENTKCKLLQSTQRKHDIRRNVICHAWLIEK